MQLIQYFSDGTITFNWEQLPEHIRSKTEIRDKIFNEIQQKLKINEFVTTRAIFELNIYVINRIRTEMKQQCSQLKMH
jgi:hypothetical protein